MDHCLKVVSTTDFLLTNRNRDRKPFKASDWSIQSRLWTLLKSRDPMGLLSANKSRLRLGLKCDWLARNW